MPTKICNDAYNYGCSNFANYATDEELCRVFRLVKTHTGNYFRNTCKECEARNMRERRKGVDRRRMYDYWDYGEMFGCNHIVRFYKNSSNKGYIT